MSNPVTNVEIEDVLSSIRRLVSNGQSERATDVTATPAGGIDPGADRLVLTPSLRVDGTLRTKPATGREEPHQPEDVSSDLGRDSEAESDLNEEQPDETAPEDLETEQPEDEFLSEHDTSSLTTQAAEFEVLVAGRDDQWEPDGASDDDYAGGPVSALDWPADDEPSEEDEVSADPDWEEADELASERHVRSWQDKDDARGSAAQESDTGRDTSLLTDDAVLDEDALRDLVSEIVRQELQGALGERITRNVRKLVRREIHRALTSQDFD